MAHSLHIHNRFDEFDADDIALDDESVPRVSTFSENYESDRYNIANIALSALLRIANPEQIDPEHIVDCAVRVAEAFLNRLEPGRREKYLSEQKTDMN